MDFSKFRQSGDLSDITITVCGTEFRLHKFPLFAKSDYFCELARNATSNTGKVEIADFPGGPEIFSMVADFCYNMPVSMTKNNIVQLRCAAEFLQMSGEGNLIEVTEKFFHDTITSAKMSRSSPAIAAMLLYSITVGQIADSAGILSACIDALVDCWSKPPTKFSSPTIKTKGSDKSVDELCIKAVIALPIDWFVKLLVTSRDRNVRMSLLAEIAVQYIENAIEIESSDHRLSQEESATNDLIGNEIKAVTKSPKGKKIDLSKILDQVILELPEEALYDDVITMDWLTKVLKMATSKNCVCRRSLVKAAGEMLNTLTSEDLCVVSPSLLHDIIIENCANDATQAEKSCSVVDAYMSEMVQKGILTAETYRLLATAIPGDVRSSHDKLYDILEYVLTAENEKMTPESRQELISSIDFKLLSEDTLQRALTAELVPSAHVAKGALALCAKLRSELDNVKYIAQMQEEELKKYQFYKGTRTAALPRLTPPMSSFTPNTTPKKEQHKDLVQEFLEPTKDTSAEIEHFTSSRNVDGRPSTQDVLTAARNKLTTNVGSAFNTFRPVSAEHDITYEDELEFKYDRAFRALDNTRMKNRQTHGHGTGHYGSGHASGHGLGSYGSRTSYPYSRF